MNLLDVNLTNSLETKPSIVKSPSVVCLRSMTQIISYLIIMLVMPVAALTAQGQVQLSSDKFRQLEERLPTANVFRAASGAPGAKYWQQKVDYEIDVQIDDATQQLFGVEQINYKNNSPDRLDYLWLQLDGNIREPHSDSHLTETRSHFSRMEFGRFDSMLKRATFDGGFKITRCQTADKGADLNYTIVKTMMRVDLPQPLAPGGTFQFAIDWNYQIADHKIHGGRSGYEYFKKDDNYLYELAQWFPRLCAYTDVNGWQHKQFLGRGEFTLEMGDYLVRITMPESHVVSATGTLLNPSEVLKPVWRERLKQAETAEDPIFIITPEEAKINQSAAKTQKQDAQTEDADDKDDDTVEKSDDVEADEKSDEDESGEDEGDVEGSDGAEDENDEEDAEDETTEDEDQVDSEDEEDGTKNDVASEESDANTSTTKTNLDSVETKTWIFKADRVRDFAFASSKKFIWDAIQCKVDNKPVMAMSFYPIEAEPLWSKYSTRAIAHTIDVYSKFAFDYPYPVAISVNGPVYGMEYPMICFNGPRPQPDGTYSKRIKYGLISVVIHEVGHNYFPMIVNSDERQWTWMDEGLNSFLQYLAEQEWEADYPSRREPRSIVSYMTSAKQVPIMTNSDSILQFGNNGYFKPATALNILRETVLGREQFDFAFRQYAQRWKFKRPMPADFFRTMEDASGVDLDWFWHGWFYTTDHVDLAITNIRQLNVNTANPDVEKPIRKQARDSAPESQSVRRNKDLELLVDEHPELLDFYNKFDDLNVTEQDRKRYQGFLKTLDEKEKNLLAEKRNFYIVDVQNQGGLVMPVILDIEYTDGSVEHVRLPAEIWRRNSQAISKLLICDKQIQRVTLDPRLETADADLSDNFFPREIKKSRFQLFKSRQPANTMQRMQPKKQKPKAKKEKKKSSKKSDKQSDKKAASKADDNSDQKEKDHEATEE